MKARIFNFAYWSDNTDPEYYKTKIKDMLLTAGFGICDEVHKHFEPYGYTCLYLLSESHFAVHTFPEHGTAYIELSSCVESQFDRFVESFLMEKSGKELQR